MTKKKGSTKKKKDSYPPTLAAYRKMVPKEKETCRCGKKLPKDVDHYDHDGGVDVKGFEKRQWLYITCPDCGYQHALWKLGVPVQDFKKLVR